MGINKVDKKFNLFFQKSFKKEFCKYYLSKVGILKIISDNNYLLKIEFINSPTNQEIININNNKIKDLKSYVDYLNSKNNYNDICLLTIQQLDEYFNYKRTSFDIPIFINGTEFQNKVWKQVAKIRYGQTCSYKDIAIKIGNPKSYRAVGNANNKNNIPIIIPCHRVIGSNNKLVGYAGGISIKKTLLKLEKDFINKNF